MAYANLSRAAHGGMAERIGLAMKSAQTAIARRRKYAETYRELNALNERELADLGIHKSMIARIAREAAYGE